MQTSRVFRLLGASLISALVLSGCTRLSTDPGPQPVTGATSISYGEFGPQQPRSGFQASGSVISAEGSSGVFGTTDAITVDDSGPFPQDGGGFDAALSDLSAADRELIEGSGLDLDAERAAASAITFSGDDGSTAFFDADVGSTIYFGTDSSELTEEARDVLRKQAAWLNVHPDVIATVEGHTDERGTRAYNLALGERRASAVRGYLTALGVGDERVRKISFGKERPLVRASNEAAWSQNRRAVTVLNRTSRPSAGAALSDLSLPSTRETSIDDLLNDPILNDIPQGDPLFDDPLLNDPLLNDPALNDV